MEQVSNAFMTLIPAYNSYRSTFTTNGKIPTFENFVENKAYGFTGSYHTLFADKVNIDNMIAVIKAIEHPHKCNIQVGISQDLLPNIGCAGLKNRIDYVRINEFENKSILLCWNGVKKIAKHMETNSASSFPSYIKNIEESYQQILKIEVFDKKELSKYISEENATTKSMVITLCGKVKFTITSDLNSILSDLDSRIKSNTYDVSFYETFDEAKEEVGDNISGVVVIENIKTDAGRAMKFFKNRS